MPSSRPTRRRRVDRLIALDAVARAFEHVDPLFGRRRRSSATSSSSTTGDGFPGASVSGIRVRDTASHSAVQAGHDRAAFALAAAASRQVVAPAPTAVAGLDRVLQHAPPQRRLRARRVRTRWCGRGAPRTCRSYSGPSRTARSRGLGLAVDAGRDVDEHHAAHHVGMACGESSVAARRATSRRPACRIRSERADRSGDSSALSRGPSRDPARSRRVPVPREIDRHQRAAERKGDRVPRVRFACRCGPAPARPAWYPTAAR